MSTSRFASILIDPNPISAQSERSNFDSQNSFGVDSISKNAPKELFLWGETPLGIFAELTPLNQLFQQSQETKEPIFSPTKSNVSNQSSVQQVFNVVSVANGLNFLVFTDETTRMTYQLGADTLGDPYQNDALVSLSELSEVKFNDPQKFACG